MAKKFFGLPRLVQILILLIPLVNWVVELIIRWSAVIEKPSIKHIVVAILFTIFGWGYVLRIVDILWVLFTKHFFLCKV